jgi:hypothetical protein
MKREADTLQGVGSSPSKSLLTNEDYKFVGTVITGTDMARTI